MSFLLKNWCEWVVFLNNGLELVTFLEKWVGLGGFYQKNGWNWVVFLEKWVKVDHFS